MHTHTYIHTYIHTYTHTCTHTKSSLPVTLDTDGAMVIGGTSSSEAALLAALNVSQVLPFAAGLVGCLQAVVVDGIGEQASEQANERENEHITDHE